MNGKKNKSYLTRTFACEYEVESGGVATLLSDDTACVVPLIGDHPGQLLLELRRK